MAETPNMRLDKPVVSSTAGPLWATMLNAISDRVDAHDHSDGYGVRITPSGMNISSDLDFNENDAIDLRSTRYASQSSLFALAADVNCAYVKSGEFYFRDASGNNVQITNGGLVNTSALTAAVWGVTDKSADYTILPSDTFAFVRVDATAGNRVITLPAASTVAAGRYYLIADGFGQCSSSRTITVSAVGSDSLGDASGPSTVTIESRYGAVLVVRAASDKWYIYRTHQLASTTEHGYVMLTGDLGGTAHAPTVLHITGTGASGFAEMRMQTLRFDDTIASPVIKQDETAGATGQDLSIAAQSAATNGGNLILASGEGSGPTTHGDVIIRAFDSEVLAAISAASPYARVGGAGGVKFASAIAAASLGFEARTSSGAGANMTITGQSGHTTGAGGNISITAGDGAGSSTGGTIVLAGGDSASGDTGSVRIDAYTGGDTMLEAREVAAGRTVLGIGGTVDATKMPANTGTRVVFFENTGTPPTTGNPSGGVILYAASGQFGWKTADGNRFITKGETQVGGTASSGAGTLPANPVGFILMTVSSGAAVKVPYYG